MIILPCTWLISFTKAELMKATTRWYNGCDSYSRKSPLNNFAIQAWSSEILSKQAVFWKWKEDHMLTSVLFQQDHFYDEDPNVPKYVRFKLMLFPVSLEGAAGFGWKRTPRSLEPGFLIPDSGTFLRTKAVNHDAEVTQERCRNNGSTEDVQPPVVQIQSRNPNPEPNVAPVVAPVVTPVPKASIPFPSEAMMERRKEKAKTKTRKSMKS
ncbi:hypothetical protein Tco_1211112 [Tanacetum coccineum]